MYMNTAKFCVALLLLGVVFAGAYGLEPAATGDDLPPVPFIVGSDDTVSPVQAASTNPLMLPADTEANPAEDSLAASADDVVADKPASVAPVNDVTSQDISSDIADVVTPTAPVPAPAEAPKVEAPVAVQPAAAPVAANASAGLLPAYVLEEPKAPAQIVGNDGLTQTVGLEHKVGTQNPLLAPVVVSPAVAVVGEDFPELHVVDIPLQDLLTYLKNFTPKALDYQFTQPILVTVDLKAKSVEEVLAFIAARYPINVVADMRSIRVTSGNGVTQGLPVPAPVVQAPAPAAPAAVPAVPSAEPMPIISSEPARGPMVPDAVQPVAPAPPPVMATVSYDGMVGDPSEGTAVALEPLDVRAKARLYELNKERQKLLDERVDLQQKARKYELIRSKE